MGCFLFWVGSTISVIGLLHLGFPLLLAVFLSPLYLIRIMLWGGASTLLWTALVVIRIATVTNRNSFWKSFHLTLNAIIVGLAPHIIFLTWYEHLIFASADTTNVEFIVLYEKFVHWLNDSLGKYLILPFFVGVSVTIIIFLTGLAFRGSRLPLALQTIVMGARCAGLVLLSASSFTILTAVPSVNWEPSAARKLLASWNAYVEDAARLAVVSALRQELARPDSQMKTEIASALHPVLPMEDAPGVARELYSEIRPSSPVEINTGRYETLLKSSNLAGPELRNAEAELEKLTIETRSELLTGRAALANLIGSSFGWTAEAFTGQLFSSFIEDAATRLAADTLAKSETIEEFSRRLSKSIPQGQRPMINLDNAAELVSEFAGRIVRYAGLTPKLRRIAENIRLERFKQMTRRTNRPRGR